MQLMIVVITYQTVRVSANILISMTTILVQIMITSPLEN